MCVYTDRNNIVSRLLRVKVVVVFRVVGSKKVVGADIDFAESYCVIVIPSCFVVIALLDIFWVS